MKNLRILNKKEVKLVLELLKEQWGFAEELDYVFLQNDKNKIFLAGREVFSIPFDQWRVNSIGLYFGEIKNRHIRLSIEGSQFIGPFAHDNIVALNDQEVGRWMKGEDVVRAGVHESFVLIKYGDDYLGTGKGKEGAILNFVPKIRRLTTVH